MSSRTAVSTSRARTMTLKYCRTRKISSAASRALWLGRLPVVAMAIASGIIVGHHLAIRTEAKVTWAGRPFTAGREGRHHIQGKASVLVLFQRRRGPVPAVAYSIWPNGEAMTWLPVPARLHWAVRSAVYPRHTPRLAMHAAPKRNAGQGVVQRGEEPGGR